MFCSSFAMAGSLSSIIFVLCLVYFPSGVESDVVNVTTTAGVLSGLFDETTGSLFLGVPYAEPPVGSLRFRAPVPKTAWEGARAAYTHGASCPQDTQSNPNLQDLPEEARVVSEDCLTLNVYSPADAVSEAVMVWLHGGAFESGQAAAFDGTDLASRGVVVVALNYRLGALGFLSTGDDSSTGNYGLLDQRLALQWVKDNIAEFGGDPSKVTLFGHDVGANSILQQLTMSEDLFSKAILQSVSSSHPLESVNNVIHAEALAAAVGCVESEYVDCLRATPLYDLMTGQKQIKSLHLERLVWGPTTTFGTQTLPVVGSKHDMIIGFSSSDGSWAVEPGQGPVSQELWEAYSGRLLVTEGDDGEKGPLQAVLNHEYLITPDGSSTDGMLRLQKVVDLNTDSSYLLPTVLLLQQAAILADSVYLYVFDQQPNSDEGYSSWLKGAPHGSILPFVWGNAANDSAWSTEEGALSDVIMAYWTNFAKYGSPNQVNSAVMWPEYEDASRKYIHLQAPHVHAQQGYRASKVDFWLNLIPKITEFSQCGEENEVLECERVPLGGTVGVTASEAGSILIVLLIALAVAGLLCIVLMTATCGYRERSKTLMRTLMRDAEVGEKSFKSLPPSITVTAPYPLEDLPPPPPPPPMDTDDTKPLIQESPTPSEGQAEEADNQAIDNDDEEVQKALQDMDTVVENADTASVNIGDAQKEEADQEPKVDDEKDEEPKNEEPPIEDEIPHKEEVPTKPEPDEPPKDVEAP